MAGDDLLVAAVHNNAAWCAAVCRSHGIASREVGGWSLADRDYPSSVGSRGRPWPTQVARVTR